MSAPSGGLFIFGWPQDADSSAAFVHGRRQARERELGKSKHARCNYHVSDI